MLNEKDISEEYDVTGVTVDTPTGPKRVLKIYKTKPLPSVRISTDTHSMVCAEDHLVRSNGSWVRAIDLQVGSVIDVRQPKSEFIKNDKNSEDSDKYACTTSKIIKIDKIGAQELYDVTVDDPNGEFFSNGIVSHNSTTLAARQLVLGHLLPEYKSQYICGQHDQLSTYGDRLFDMEDHFRFPVKGQNKYSKKYGKGSQVYLNYCLTSANSVRGRTVDECAWTEAPVCVKSPSDGNDKYVKLSDIKPGDLVKSVACDEGEHESRYNRVIAYQSKGIRTCWRLRTESGREVVCTANHKLRARGRWIYMADIIAAQSREESITLVTEAGYERVVAIDYVGKLPVADIQVERDECYFIDSVLSHNCVLDEAQGIDSGIVPEMLYIQTTSKIPSTIFAGTSLTVDTLLESKWQSSSQGMWNVRAMDGKHWLNMHDQETLYKVCNNPKGPTCPYTGKILKVENGCYVHSNLQALAVGDIGVHVPQAIIPDLVYNPIQWGKIYKKIQTDDFKKVLQECFGIAVSEGSREISESDLVRICVLKDTQEEIKKKCWNGYYRMIISGCDWGGSDYNPAVKTKTSYTVHMIIGLAPDGAVDILYGKRYSGMEYPEIAADIVAAHKNYNGNIIATDFGVGMAYNTEIRNRLPFDSHFIMSYVGPETPPISEPKNAHLMNQLSINRTEAISKVYAAIKSSFTKVRCRNWEDMQVYLLDFLNMYRVPTELPNGKNGFRYLRNAQKADDALHAFTFAYTMMLFYMGIPMVNDVALERKIRDMMNSRAGGTTPTQQELRNSIYGDPNYIVFG